MLDDLFLAVKTGNLDWLEQCYNDSKTDFNSLNSEGLAPIHLAALKCQLSSLVALVERYGADISVKSSDGRSVMHLALSGGSQKDTLKVVAYLIKKNVDLNCCTTSMWSPLHEAAHQGYLKCVKLLLLKKANPNIPDLLGSYPHDIAKNKGYKACYRILYQAFWACKQDRIWIQKRELAKITAVYNNLLKEALQQLILEQKYFGNLTHNNWLENKGLAKADVNVDHLDNKKVLLRRFENLKKRLLVSGEEAKKFVDCSTRVENLSSKFICINTNLTFVDSPENFKTKNNSIKWKNEHQKEDTSENDTVSKKSSVQLDYDASVVIKPVPKLLETYVKVDYAKNKPTLLKVHLPGKKDRPIVEFPDLTVDELNQAFKGTSIKNYEKFEYNSILEVDQKRFIPSSNNDPMKHLKLSSHNTTSTVLSRASSQASFSSSSTSASSIVTSSQT